MAGVLTVSQKENVMRLARTAALGAIAGTLFATLTLGVAFPASAETPNGAAGPLFPATAAATDYALTVRGMDIYAAQPEAARAAWSAQLGRVAAANANVYRAAQVYGTLDPAQLADVLPINSKADVALSGKLTSGLQASNGAAVWKGTGFRFPRFPSGPIAAARSVAGGPVGATVALLAFNQRADIANGVASWVGMDATGAVCSDPVAGGKNPINWITGQNCDQWKADQAFTADKANSDIVPGVTFGPACSTVDPLRCATLQGVGRTIGSSDNSVLCFRGTYNGGGALTLRVSVQTTKGPVIGSPLSLSDLSSYWGYACTAFTQINAYDFPGGEITGVDSYWYADGDKMSAPVTPVTADTDPLRQFQCTMYGASGAVTNGFTDSFKESHIVGGSAPPPVCTPLPNQEDPNRVVYTEVGGPFPVVYYDKTQTSAASDFDTKYKTDCGTGSTQHTCLLDLVQTGNGISCFSATANCTDWFHDPSRDSKYQCQYGGKDEPVQQCYVLANTFDAAKRAAGNPYADPLTGNDPGQGTGSDLDTQTMGNPAGSVVQPDGSVASCYGGGSPGAFNPISWIVRGGQCLLNWAFVPRPLVVQARMGVVSANWQANGIGKLVTAVNGWHISPVVSGCSSSLAFPVPMIQKTITVPIIQACPGTPMGDFAPWVRGLVSAGLMITAGFAVKRIVSGWVPA